MQNTSSLFAARGRTMLPPIDPDPASAPLAADEDEAASGDGPGKVTDPAHLAASVMLAAALVIARRGIADLTKPGTITLVVTPDASWVEHVRRSWTADISGEGRTGDGTRDYGFYGSPDTVIFTASESLSQARRDIGDNCFAKAVGHRIRIVGVAPEPGWLPADLVAAADHSIELAPLSPDDVANLARLVASGVPTTSMTAADAACVTPRLARLAVRPAQTADDYLRKLRALVAADQTAAGSAAAAAQVRPQLRCAPTLDRLHGLDDAVAWGLRLREDIAAFEAGQRAWDDVDRGLLLSGPPGTGKTVFARALAATCGVPLVSGSYGVWLSNGAAHQGDLIKAMRKAFQEAKDRAPAILFIDEIDTFADRAKVKHAAEWHTEVVNTLLGEIDGVESRKGVVVIGACNHPHKLDPALVRSGRLDRHIAVGLPGAHALARILREHVGPQELPEQNFGQLGLLLLGATGADVERLVRGARRRARTAGRPMLEADIVAEAGAEDPRGPADLQLCSVHEAGHAVAAVMLGFHVEGVSVRDGGAHGGNTRVTFRRLFLHTDDVHDHVVALLSGRAAEEVLLSRVTSGAGGGSGSDLQRATWLAASAVAELGLDPGHGMTWTPLPEREAELTAMLAADSRLAACVRQRLDDAYEDALTLIRRSADAVAAVAKALIDRGSLDGAELRQIASVGCHLP